MASAKCTSARARSKHCPLRLVLSQAKLIGLQSNMTQRTNIKGRARKATPITIPDLNSDHGESSRAKKKAVLIDDRKICQNDGEP